MTRSDLDSAYGTSDLSALGSKYEIIETLCSLECGKRVNSGQQSTVHGVDQLAMSVAGEPTAEDTAEERSKVNRVVIVGYVWFHTVSA